MIECNVGGTDKVIRMILGVVFIAAGLFFFGTPVAKGVSFVLAAIAFVTAFTGFCPLNKLIGLNTCKK